MDYQLEEVYARSITHPRLLGPTFQSRESHYISSRLILRFSHQCPIPSINIHGHSYMQDLFHHQSNLALHPFYPSRAPTTQVPAVLDEETLGSAQAVLGHSTPAGCRLSLSPPMVQQTGHSPGSTSASAGTQPVLLHRCITNRMGHQLSRSSPLGTVVSPGLLSAHQLPGARGHPISCSSVGPHWLNQTIRVYCDNSTAVAYIRKQGGSHSISLFNKTLELLHPLDQFGILLIPTHLPGARNETADTLSRLNSPSLTEWRLPQETLLNLFSVLGNPLVDMFATAENRVTPIYVSPYPDDRAWAVDALSISWDGLGLVYVFPPAPIIPKTLQKIKDSHDTTVILIASQHPSQPWHPLLLQLSRHPPIQLTNVALYQYVPNIRSPQLHKEPRLLDPRGHYPGFPQTAWFPRHCSGYGGWSSPWFFQSHL